MSSIENLNLPNLREIERGLWASGQPTEAQLRWAATAGVRTVINLCPAGECGWDERATAGSLGLAYVSIPIGGAADLGHAAAQALHDALSSCDRPVLLHCGSANRVGALIALKSALIDRAPAEAALEHGRAAGLQGLEPAVRALLAGAR
ncbi:MAG: sulfur transferase domain-containing protein [Gammaproteobacteria bacterium]